MNSLSFRTFLIGITAMGTLLVPLIASASVSVSLQNLSPSTTVTVGTSLTFSIDASGFTNPTYSVTDSFDNSSVTNGDIDSSGNFSWTPTQNDIGTHNLTITVSDSQGDTATVEETITVSQPASLSVGALSPGSSVTAGETVTFTASPIGFVNPSFSVSDSYGGSSITSSNINSSGNFSWTPGSNQEGTHTITVTATDAEGHSASVSETISVSAPGTVVIQSIAPGSTVNIGQTLTFTAVASGFTNPSYSISDSFSGSSLTSSDINSSGNFSWTPDANDAGTHTITVTVSGNSGQVATASETFTVGSGVAIQGLSPGTTVIVNNPLTFTIAASSFNNPSFTVSDSFAGSSISNADINSAGYFSWTPGSNQVGTHTITVYAVDSYGHNGSVSEEITVETPNITVTSITPAESVNPNTTVNFTVSQQGFVNPTYTLSDSFPNTTITNSDINSSGEFSWTPGTNQVGTHTITIYATDSEGHSNSTTITLYVIESTSVALTSPLPNSTVAPGTTVTFSADAFGFTNPTYAVSDSFAGSSVTSADLNSSGDFSWTPTASDGGIHTITVTVTDSYSHEATAQTTITVSGTGAPAPLSTPSSNTFTEYLYPGIGGAQVTQLQTALTNLGYFSGPITGYYGSLTEAAVIKYQAAHGIEQLGVVGPATRAALNSNAPSTSSSTYQFSTFLGVGSSGEAVTQLQERLTALGVYSGPITGYFGSLTQTAVGKFQGLHGIEQVGYVGPATRAALNQ